jgi:ATP-binding cassette, subfamily B, bacterial
LKANYFQKIRGLRQLRRAFILVWESARCWTAAGLAFIVLQAFLPLLTLYLIKLTVDAVTFGISAPDKTAALGRVFLWISLTALAALITSGCRALADIVKEHQSQLVTDHVTDIIHRKSAEVDLAYYENSHYYDTLHRAQQEAPYRPNHIVQAMTQLGQNGISLIALAGLLFYLHWAVAAILFAAVLPGIIVKIRHADHMYEWLSRTTETERRTSDYHWMLTDELHAKELRLFDLGGLFRKRYRDLREKLRSERLRLARNRSVLDLIAQTGAILALFGMLAFIAARTIQGMITLGDMVMYYGAFQRAQGHLQEIMGGFAGLYEDSMFLNYFYDFLDLKPQTASPASRTAVPKPMQTGIVLEHVSFKYPNSSDNVLNGVELKIRPGEVVALVGDNGAGKTTLAKLLCRLYDPAGGRITMDGMDFRDFDIHRLRREITMIFQDYIHYPFTVRENIRLGDVSLSPDDERIQTAARQAGADGIISHLPHGYETILGNRYNGGMELSIGEWQKVALARAFLRNAQLIILDEPTSAMSARMEHEIFQAFHKLLNGRSALIISHRFSTVRMADLICVLEDGKIIESGSHEELIKLGGHYARLYEIQAKKYR